jgi:uncharacterized repeat protein (TIGR04076 family)
MANPEKVILKIISVKGTCALGHQEGQEFDLSQDLIVGFSKGPQVLCSSIFYAIYPRWQVLRHGGEFPWEEDRDKAYAACPDPFNPVAVELRRVRE